MSSSFGLWHLFGCSEGPTIGLCERRRVERYVVWKLRSCDNHVGRWLGLLQPSEGGVRNAVLCEKFA